MANEFSAGAAPHGAAHNRIAEDILVLTAGLGAGAGVMYLCDSRRGRARRGRLIAEFSHLIPRDKGRGAKRAKDLLNRVGGLAAEAVSALVSTLDDEGPVPDEVLVGRVRGRMGHILANPDEIRVHAREGVVTLQGQVTHTERRRLRQELRGIAGVRRVNDCLTTRSLLAPGLLMGLAAGLALFGNSGSSRSGGAAGRAG
jgi:hypothetical protein